MKLNDRYNRLWFRSVDKFESDEFEPDTKIDDPNDDRYGLTLLIRPSLKIRKKINDVLQKLRPYAPDQYYYPVSDMHITVLSIISCQPGFELDQINTEEYLSVIRSAVGKCAPFKIEVKGISASPSAIMICGYPEANALNMFREHIRHGFKNSSLYHTIDKRYALETAHITVFRFRETLSKPQLFTGALKEIKETSFGTDTVQELELVGNDWYQRKRNVKLIKKFWI